MILLIIIIVLAVWLIGLYNGLISKRNHVDNAFAQIDVQLKKRYDLIPNIVATVKQYAEHELAVFSAITAMRSRDYSTLSTEEKEKFDHSFQQAATNFRAVAENYPILKASENFEMLQRTLNETEEQLSAARRTFNAAITDYNTSIQSFPANIIASNMGFQTRTLLEIPEVERQNVNVSDLFKR